MDGKIVFRKGKNDTKFTKIYKQQESKESHDPQRK